MKLTVSNKLKTPVVISQPIGLILGSNSRTVTVSVAEVEKMKNELLLLKQAGAISFDVFNPAETADEQDLDFNTISDQVLHQISVDDNLKLIYGVNIIVPGASRTVLMPVQQPSDLGRTVTISHQTGEYTVSAETQSTDETSSFFLTPDGTDTFDATYYNSITFQLLAECDTNQALTYYWAQVSSVGGPG